MQIHEAMITKTNSRRTHADGSISDYVTFKFPSSALKFVDIDQGDEAVKLKDAAHYRFVKAQEGGEAEPLIVTFGLLRPDRPAAELFPNLPFTTEAGEQLLSANSGIIHTMRILFRRGWVCYKQGVWQTAVPTTETSWRKKGQAVLNYLTTNNLLHLHTTRGDDLDFSQIPLDIEQDLVPVAGCGFLSDFNRRQQPTVAFNTLFFLLEPEDIFSHHSALFEPFGFFMADGVIQRPPLYRRGTIWQHADGRWQTGLLGMADLRIILPNGWQLVYAKQKLSSQDRPFSLNDEGPSPITLYTRYYGVAEQGHVLGQTPVAPGRFELTVVDRRIVGWKMGGGLPLPQNGFVLSFAEDVFTAEAKQTFLSTLTHQFRVTYQFAAEPYLTIQQGVQVGPMLLQDGRSPLTNSYLEAVEQFWPSRFMPDGRWQNGVVSTSYKTDVDQTRSGRVGIGLDAAGNVILVMAVGVNSGMDVPGVDSVGATLTELAQLLQEAGAVTAVNLDGGGSTQAYFMGGRAITPGDRRGQPQTAYQRMIPSVGVVK
ncbi:MAG: hypothetical protein DHS20C20_09760 [Ardenticatenaceae bacterium]|nr:MAG: hypothetical protein DHS20C20_09760 [Ardenticatenaceae bacterium]